MQNFSEGRLILGAGVGWLEAEFAALGAPFHERGRRMDEGIAMMRAVWTQDPVTFRSKYIPAEISEMTMRPLPDQPIPIWFGGTLGRGVPAHGQDRRRLARQPADPGRRRRRSSSGCARDRPEPGFTISMRTHWNGKDQGELRERIAAYAEAGVQHVMIHPLDRDVDDWDAVIEGTGRVAAG